MMKTQERRVNSRRKTVIRKQQKYISFPNQTQSVTITLWSKVFWMNSASVQAKAWLTVNSLSIDSAACCVCVCMCVRFIADSISPQVIVIMETQPLSHNTATLHLCVCVSVCVILHQFYLFRAWLQLDRCLHSGSLSITGGFMTTTHWALKYQGRLQMETIMLLRMRTGSC